MQKLAAPPWWESNCATQQTHHPNCYVIECLERISVNERDLSLIVQELGQTHN